MKILKFIFTAFGLMVILFTISLIIAVWTGMFSVGANAHIGGGRGFNAGFNISVSRCVQTSETGSICRGFTINEAGIARTESHGGQPHN